jgi:hypothetical protein
MGKAGQKKDRYSRPLDANAWARSTPDIPGIRWSVMPSMQLAISRLKASSAEAASTTS